MGQSNNGEGVTPKSMIYLPFFIRSRLVDSVNVAEQLKGSPGNTAEVHTVTKVKYGNWGAMGWTNAFLQNLYREDYWYCDPHFTWWSTTLEGEGKEGWENMTMRFQRLYPGYMLDKKMHIVAKKDTFVFNLKTLVDLFKSKDEKLWEMSQWMFDDNFKFLDGQANKSNKVAFGSFPRSGNTFLRKYFELLTGVQTGADNTMHLNVSLQHMGMKGEDTVDDTVWIVKTHSPWIMPFQPKFTANKMVTIIRNPLDVVISWLTLSCMLCHNAKLPYDPSTEYPKFWDWWVRDCSTVMGKWYRQQMKDATERNIPTLFVRFEDLVMDPEPELANIMKFLIGEKDISGTNAERRVKEVVAKGKDATQTYKIKDTTRKFNAHASKYNEEQTQFVMETMKDMMYFFGYTKDPKGESETQFFDFGESEDPALAETYCGYLKHNQETLDWVAGMSEAELEQIQFQLSDKSKEVEVQNDRAHSIMSRSIIDWSEKLLYGKASDPCK